MQFYFKEYYYEIFGDQSEINNFKYKDKYVRYGDYYLPNVVIDLNKRFDAEGFYLLKDEVLQGITIEKSGYGKSVFGLNNIYFDVDGTLKKVAISKTYELFKTLSSNELIINEIANLKPLDTLKAKANNITLKNRFFFEIDYQQGKTRILRNG